MFLFAVWSWMEVTTLLCVIPLHLLHQVLLIYIMFLRVTVFLYLWTSSQNIYMSFISSLFPSPSVYLSKHC